jgi:hypothetical protein
VNLPQFRPFFQPLILSSFTAQLFKFKTASISIQNLIPFVMNVLFHSLLQVNPEGRHYQYFTLEIQFRAARERKRRSFSLIQKWRPTTMQLSRKIWAQQLESAPRRPSACRLQLCTSDFDANNRYVGQQTAQQLMRNASPAWRIMIN